MSSTSFSLTVADAAKYLDLSIDTIRRWEKKGLIQSERSIHNHRLFAKTELKRLALKHSGKYEANRYQILKARGITKYSVVELFSGAGGMALGFENAGLQTKRLVELDKDAAASLRMNRKKKWDVIEKDIHHVSFKDLCDQIDVVAGGFPCQAFSYAGNGHGFGDARGTLFFEFARCVSEIQPKIAVAENVRGLLQHDGGRTFQTMLLELASRGYRVDYKLLRAQFLDVPQKRERLLIVAIRKDLDIPFLFPRERDYTVSLREALKKVPPSEGAKYPKYKKEVLDLIPPGGYWKDLPLDIQKSYLGGSFHLSGGKTGMARRLAWEEPSLTLTCSPAQKQTERCHPKETRPLTVREYARIQTFPDEWMFSGGTSSQYKQIGNAVPVNLGYHIGSAIICMLRKKWDKERFRESTGDQQQDRNLRLFT